MGTLGVLHDISSTTAPWIVGQFNAVEIEKDLFFAYSTRVAGTPVVTLGPPTAGTWQLSRRYRDGYGGEFLCTVAGTPGTWIQIAAAVVSANPGSPTTGYWIIRVDLNFAQYYWSGAAWVAIGGGTAMSSATPQTVGGAAAAAGVGTLPLPDDHKHALADFNSTYYPARLKARLNLVLLR